MGFDSVAVGLFAYWALYALPFFVYIEMPNEQVLLLHLAGQV
jgi:hypothetical protein